MAVKYKFSKNFDYYIPGKRAHVAYLAGQELTIPDDHAEAADKAQAGARTVANQPSSGTAQAQNKV